MSFLILAFCASLGGGEVTKECFREGTASTKIGSLGRKRSKLGTARSWKQKGRHCLEKATVRMLTQHQAPMYLKLKRETETLAVSAREELESRRNKEALIHSVPGPWKITHKTNIYMVELSTCQALCAQCIWSLSSLIPRHNLREVYAFTILI